MEAFASLPAGLATEGQPVIHRTGGQRLQRRTAMASGFGLFFVGHTVPITHDNLTQVDPTHWVLDASVIPNYAAMREVALFLLPGSVLDPNAALGLYVRAGNVGGQAGPF